MSRNFTGKIADRFHTNTSDALTRAGNVHNQNPFEGMRSGDVPFPQLPHAANQSPQSLMQASRSAMAGNVGNSSNIVVDPNTFTQAIQRMDSIDDHVGAEVFGMLGQVEEMCATIFKVPSTVQRIRSLCDEVKRCLGPFRGATEEVAIDTRRFVNAISDIDHGNSGEIAISQVAVSQAVQMARTTIDRQVSNMQRTASTYNTRADRLELDAEREQRRADDIQRQIDEAIATGGL